MTDWLSPMEDAAERDVWCAAFRGSARASRSFGRARVIYDPRANAFAYFANHVPRTRLQMLALDPAETA
jgi:hypothetical protein